jgi:MFS transporter, ACS family, aldohexuronate transporter
MATGIFSSGSAVGAIIAAPVIAVCTLSLGWRWAFLLPGLLGFLWLPFWCLLYKDHGPFETRSNRNDSSNTSWRALLHKREVWGLVLPRLASDPVWYFYLFWLPDYLQHERHLTLQEIGFYGWIPFLLADIGSVAGGAWSDALVRRGRNPSSARIFVLVVVGCVAPLGAVVGIVPGAAAAVAITCAIAFLTQCWSTNTAALASDIFPSSSVGSVTGMMGTAGGLGGILFAQVLGVLILHVGYASAFVAAAMLHPAATITLLMFLNRKRKRQHEPISEITQ